MLKWFSSKEEETFGKELAQFLADRLPPKAKLSDAKQEQLFPKFVSKIDQFKSSHKLNMYKKAKLANSFKWHLLDLDFANSFVDEMTKELVLLL